MNIFQEIKNAFVKNKNFLILATLIFVIPFFIGFLFKPYLHSFLFPVTQEITQKFSEGIIQFNFQTIFLNNLGVLCKIFLLGIFCGVSAFLLGFNAIFSGYYMAGSQVFKKFLLMMPHGIFEFSSLIIGTAAGFLLFKIIYNFIKSLLIKEFTCSVDEYFDILMHALILFGVSIVLMFIAGLIEVYLTIPFAMFILSV